jgi:Zn-dependent protease
MHGMAITYVVFGLFWAGFAMSIVLHEVAHGWVALQCGDPTALREGRLSLNPLKHVDPVMTILVPILTTIFVGFPFGGAKPVPVNPYNFRNLDVDDLKVSLAGVTVNFSLAAIFGIPLRFMDQSTVGYTLFTLLGSMNLFLGLFNLMPIPPLDGSHVVRFFLAKIDRGMADAYEKIGVFGFMIVLLMWRFFGGYLSAAMYYVWNALFVGGVDPLGFVIDFIHS